MKKNNKGFTLVELLAVTIILLIIIFIAFTKIKGSSQKSKKNAVRASAITYVKAINGFLNEDSLTNPRFKKAILNKASLEDFDIKVSGEKPTGVIAIVDNFEISNACIEYGTYYVTYSNGEYSNAKRGKCSNDESFSNLEVFDVTTFTYSGSPQTFTASYTGTYKFELWGASGSNNSLGGKGAYTSGYLTLNTGDELYVYVGQQATGTSATYNGGGSSGGNGTAGGGATDIRLVSGAWNNQTSLASRIMVAAGGAGYNVYKSGYKGGAGGSLNGFVGEGDSQGTAATQTSGGVSYNNNASWNGSFGKGGNADNWGGGGSGGYWGGSGGKNSSTGNGGTSGSSYISGYLGCVAIKSETEIVPKDGCDNDTTDISCSYHYSGIKFIDPVMKAGNEVMPTTDGTSTMTGNLGQGFVRISLT